MDIKDNWLEKSIAQIGIGPVQRSLPEGVMICTCDVHGKYLCPSGVQPQCPLCPSTVDAGVPANGTTATQLEHVINVTQNLC